MVQLWIDGSEKPRRCYGACDLQSLSGHFAGNLARQTFMLVLVLCCYKARIGSVNSGCNASSGMRPQKPFLHFTELMLVRSRRVPQRVPFAVISCSVLAPSNSLEERFVNLTSSTSEATPASLPPSLQQAWQWTLGVSITHLSNGWQKPAGRQLNRSGCTCYTRFCAHACTQACGRLGSRPGRESKPLAS